MTFIFHNESYETDITTDKTMIKIVRVMAYKVFVFLQVLYDGQ